MERRGLAPSRMSLHAYVHVAVCLCVYARVGAHLCLCSTVDISWGRNVCKYGSMCAVIHVCEAGSVPHLSECLCVSACMSIFMSDKNACGVLAKYTTSSPIL